MSDMERMDSILSDEEEEFEPNDTTRLVEGVDLKELLRTKTAQFSVQINEDAALEEQKTLYNSENVLDHINLDCLGLDGDDSETCAPGETPFSQISKKMFDLTRDGKVKKRVLSEGYGPVVPPDGLVWIHYNSYIEYAEVPFDSSYLRGHTTMIRLGQCRCIIGLDVGIATMKAGETAQFLIHFDYAYGRLGVPPRIPPESDILIHVELKKFVDNAEAMKLGKASDEELESMTFDKIYKGALSLLLEGNNSFNTKKYNPAIKMYKRAVECLIRCNMENSEQEQKSRDLLTKLYTNLAVAYNKVHQPRLAIAACNNAIHYNKTLAKAFYQRSVALLILSAYEEAKDNALHARMLAPNSREISKLLVDIDTKIRRYDASSISFAKRTLNIKDARASSAKLQANRNQNGNEETTTGNTASNQLNVSYTTENTASNQLNDSNYDTNRIEENAEASSIGVENTEPNRLNESSLGTIRRSVQNAEDSSTDTENTEPNQLNESSLDTNEGSAQNTESSNIDTENTESEKDHENPEHDESSKEVAQEENSYIPYCGRAFELETIQYIEEFVADPSEHTLPVPCGLTYEEENFFKNQAANYRLFWQEIENNGTTLVFLKKVQ